MQPTISIGDKIQIRGNSTPENCVNFARQIDLSLLNDV